MIELTPNTDYRGLLLKEARDIRDRVARDHRDWKGDSLLAWTMEWSERLIRTLGKAIYVPRVIRLSWPAYRIPENREAFRNTVIHELAHAICGPWIGHKTAWRRMHRALGGDGRRCTTLAVVPLRARDRQPVEVWCPRCTTTVLMGPVQARRMRRGIQYQHSGCGGTVVALKMREAANRVEEGTIPVGDGLRDLLTRGDDA